MRVRSAGTRAGRTLISRAQQSSRSCGRVRLLRWVAAPVDPTACLRLSKAQTKIGGNRYAQPQDRRDQDWLVSRHDYARDQMRARRRPANNTKTENRFICIAASCGNLLILHDHLSRWMNGIVTLLRHKLLQPVIPSGAASTRIGAMRRPSTSSASGARIYNHRPSGCERRASNCRLGLWFPGSSASR